MDEPLRAAALLRIAEASASQAEALRRAARRDDLRRVRRGAYVGSDHWSEIDDTQRHLIAVRANVAALRADAVVSHRSAAAVWGLPVVGCPSEGVHVTFPGRSGGVSRADLARHATDRPLAHQVVDGIDVTSVARTVVDLARAHGFLAGVAAGDAALHRGIVTLDELCAEADCAGSRRGSRVARDVVGFIDGRCESPGESLSRVRMRELGLPTPELQHVVRDSDGFVGRVDFWWDDARVIGEFDGRSKYGMEESIPQAADRLWDEKVREDRLRRTGTTVVRWTWADAWRGAPMAARLRQAGVTPARSHRAHSS